ncbi:unnamed protein product [Symbiodinium sp. CCMP2592]|nr:unnamed protein product [Symbiodinium sp. CCMP2592]
MISSDSILPWAQSPPRCPTQQRPVRSSFDPAVVGGYMCIMFCGPPEALSQTGKVLEALRAKASAKSKGQGLAKVPKLGHVKDAEEGTRRHSAGKDSRDELRGQDVKFISEQQAERNRNAPSSTMLSTTVMYEQRADKKEEGLYEGCYISLLGKQQPTTNLGGITPPSFSINCASAAHQGKERDAKDAKGKNDREKTKEHRDNLSLKPAVIWGLRE